MTPSFTPRSSIGAQHRAALQEAWGDSRALTYDKNSAGWEDLYPVLFPSDGPQGSAEFLDIAGGDGVLGAHALELGWKAGVVVDLSDSMLKRAGARGLQTRQAAAQDIARIGLRDDYDIAFARHLLPYIEPSEAPAVMREISKVSDRQVYAHFVVPDDSAVRQVFESFSAIAVPGYKQVITTGQTATWAQQAGLEVVGHWQGLTTPDDYTYRIPEGRAPELAAKMSEMPSVWAQELGLDSQNHRMSRRLWDVVAVKTPGSAVKSRVR
ncbi:MAG: class I SAM-dependent methyltransferase [Corynebacteriales bacterium]|nr:class I SAM-dependent methyltransferase [Mycobacteriales bacterium]